MFEWGEIMHSVSQTDLLSSYQDILPDFKQLVILTINIYSN